MRRTGRTMLLTGLLALTLALPVSLDSLGTGIDFSALQRHAAPATVLIETQIARGTGFVVDASGVVVTACHVVNEGVEAVELNGAPARVVNVFFEGDPRTYLAEIENGCRLIGSVAQSEAMLNASRDDVAVLRIVGSREASGAFEPLASPTGFARLWLADERPAFSETVFVSGFGGPFTEYSFLSGTLAGNLTLVTAPIHQVERGIDAFFDDFVVLEEGLGLFDSRIGLVVTDLVEGGAAARAGLGIGDVVTALDGAPFTLFEALDMLIALGEGDVVELTVSKPDGRTARATVEATEYAVSQTVRFVESLWCFDRTRETLDQADFERAELLDLTLARNTLSAAARWAGACPGTVLATTFAVGDDGLEFEFVGRVTEVGADTLTFEALNTFALVPFEGELVSLERGGQLESSSFIKITALSGPGFSGGPVLNAAGQVIGFVDFGFEAPAPGYIVEADVIRAHLEALGIE